MYMYVCQRLWILIDDVLEHEVRALSSDNVLTLDESTFCMDSDREKIMDELESIRSCSIYPHLHCSLECKKRGKQNPCINV